jgi:hypothetical protein
MAGEGQPAAEALDAGPPAPSPAAASSSPRRVAREDPQSPVFSLAFARRQSVAMTSVNDRASVRRYGESAGRPAISRLWAVARA